MLIAPGSTGRPDELQGHALVPLPALVPADLLMPDFTVDFELLSDNQADYLECDVQNHRKPFAKTGIS